ncbi:MAG: transcriptional regulator [Akkermansiaceae bacterium]|nr:transcriptional regulator [Akkermansiaceae bacterium]
MAGRETLNEVERRVVEFCCDGVRIVGLPKSIGEIYGLLFISREPQSLDDLVSRLGISKGSASQGLKLLRTLGAIRQVSGEDSRRTYYEADMQLKSLVGGFVREQVRPHLASGDAKLKGIAAAAATEEESETREFYENRIFKLERWSKQARLILPLLQRVLGG